MKKLLIISGIIVLICSVLFGYYIYQISPVSKEEKKIEVVIPQGSSGSSIADLLSKKGLIRNADVFKLYLKVYNVKGLNYGKYILNTNMDVPKIIKTLQGKPVADKIVISFIEGYDIPKIAKKIADSTNNTEEDVYALLKDESYLDELIAEYWFIKSDIKNDKLYYPLEGYLFPDTYFFENKDVTVKDVFRAMLKQMDKVLSQYKEEIALSKFTIHEILTFASIVEKESLTKSDGDLVASVFYNRLEKKWTLGSCPTNCYATRTENCVPKKVVAKYQSPYNTYLENMGGKLPVGPISSPGKNAINSVLKPVKSDYMWFVADKNTKSYFYVTYSEREKGKADLKSKGLWFD